MADHENPVAPDAVKDDGKVTAKKTNANSELDNAGENDGKPGHGKTVGITSEGLVHNRKHVKNADKSTTADEDKPQQKDGLAMEDVDERLDNRRGDQAAEETNEFVPQQVDGPDEVLPGCLPRGTRHE